MAGMPTAVRAAAHGKSRMVAVGRSLPGEVDLEAVMGKYVVAWLLGVPAFVLVIIYMFAR